MAALIRLTRVAYSDLDQIIDELTLRAGRPVADKYERVIEAAFHRISDHPGIGSPRRSLGPNLRVMVVHPFLIFYEGEPKSEIATVLRIVHGRRRIDRNLIDESRNG